MLWVFQDFDLLFAFINPGGCYPLNAEWKKSLQKWQKREAEIAVGTVVYMGICSMWKKDINGCGAHAYNSIIYALHKKPQNNFSV